MAYRYFGLRIGHSWLQGLLLFVRGRNTFLLCTLDVIGFAVCCCPAEAYRLFILRIENNSLRNLSHLCNRGRARVREQQETCECQKHPIYKNQKRSAGGVRELQKNAKQKRINAPNNMAICHRRWTKDFLEIMVKTSIYQYLP